MASGWAEAWAPTRTVLGVLILGAIGSALTFLSIGTVWQGFVTGSAINIAVAIDALQNRQRRA